MKKYTIPDAKNQGDPGLKKRLPHVKLDALKRAGVARTYLSLQRQKNEKEFAVRVGRALRAGRRRMLLRQVRQGRCSEVRVPEGEVLPEVHLQEVLRRQALLPEVRVLLRQERMPEGQGRLPEKAVRQPAEVS